MHSVNCSPSVNEGGKDLSNFFVFLFGVAIDQRWLRLMCDLAKKGVAIGIFFKNFQHKYMMEILMGWNTLYILVFS